MYEQDQQDALCELPPVSTRKAMVTKTYRFDDGRRATQKRLDRIQHDEEVASKVVAAINGVHLEEVEVHKYTGF